MNGKPKNRNGTITVAGTQKEARALAARSIAETMVDFETVRRFISKGLNQSLQRAEATAKKKNLQLSEQQRKKLEIDYGTIPGVNKPFLLQPGAEKIARWLKVRPVYDTADTELGNGHLEVVSRCRLLDRATHEEVFQGPRCSCSSMEPNFRYRWVQADPQPSKDWIFSEGKVRKAEGTGKSVKEWKNGKPTGNWLWMDRVENKDIHGERNKIRQMGEKRAIVKAIRNYGALSEIFTEDPSEWAFPDEDEGVEAEEPPTGKVVRETPKESSQGMGETRQNVAPGGASSASVSPSKIITVTWGSDASEVAYITGDIAEIVEQIKGAWQGIKLEDREAYVLPASFILDLEEWCERNGYQVQEISGSSKPAEHPKEAPHAPPVTTQPEAAAPAGTGKGGPEIKGDSGPAAVQTVQGTVKQIRMNKSKAKNGSIESYNVLIGELGSGSGLFYYAYNRNLWPILDQAINKPVTVLVKQKAIVGFVKVNGRTFDSDGITPEIQNGEDRPKPESLFE
jgi:hypothetical protein